MSQKLILLSDTPEDQTFCQALADQLSLNFVHFPELPAPAKLPEALQNVKHVFINPKNAEHFAKVEAQIIPLKGAFDLNDIHLMSSSPLEKHPYITQSTLFSNYVHTSSFKSDQLLEDAAQRYGRILFAKSASRAFGLENQFISGVSPQTVHFKNADQKQSAVEAVKGLLMAQKFQARMASLIANSIDEILMNAMFDAPTDTSGKQLFNNVARTENIELTGKQTVEMKIAVDDPWVAFTVIDLFGSLSKERLMQHISRTYNEEGYKIRTTGAGAGIGLATIFKQGASLFFVSEKDIRTEVTVFFKKHDSFRDFKDQFHFLSTQFYS